MIADQRVVEPLRECGTAAFTVLRTTAILASKSLPPIPLEDVGAVVCGVRRRELALPIPPRARSAVDEGLDHLLRDVLRMPASAAAAPKPASGAAHDSAVVRGTSAGISSSTVPPFRGHLLRLLLRRWRRGLRTCSSFRFSSSASSRPGAPSVPGRLRASRPSRRGKRCRAAMTLSAALGAPSCVCCTFSALAALSRHGVQVSLLAPTSCRSASGTRRREYEPRVVMSGSLAMVSRGGCAYRATVLHFVEGGEACLGGGAKASVAVAGLSPARAGANRTGRGERSCSWPIRSNAARTRS